ncbi:hypothetical protein [Streptomyces paludis]|nr:hypothetical protein [Streptomyces paludis]
MSLALLLTTAAATAVGVAALHAAHVLRRQVSALRAELAANPGGLTASVPQARTHPVETHAIRTAVAEALAEERERELAEARAFWAAQEARDASDTPPAMLGGLAGLGTEDTPFYVPRQADFAGLETPRPHDGADGMGADGVGPDSLDGLLDEFTDFTDFADYPELTEVGGHGEAAEYAEDSAELAAARRRHPSHPDFVPVRTPVVTDYERTVARLEELAETRTALADVRPGPLGTLDVYVFADGTTLCMTPGHRETAERLAEALRAGAAPFLLGGSGISGAYALTFACGEDAGQAGHIYILADRVIASL